MIYISKDFNWTCLLVLFLVALSSLAVMGETETYTVVQGDYSQEITPLEKPESIENFYDYHDAEAHTDPDIELSHESILFLYKDKNTGKLSLVVIHHDGEGGPGGSLNQKADFTFSGIPSTANTSVKDDDGDDDFSLNSKIGWDWGRGKTDGVAISGIGDTFSIKITPNFKNGIYGWMLVTGDINDPTYKSIPSLTESIEITSGESQNTKTLSANKWNLLSIPLSPSPSDCSSVIGDDLPAGNTCSDLVFGPWNGSDFESPPFDLDPLEGFWIWAPSEFTIGVSGSAPNEEIQLADRSGWFMIGSPGEIAWGDVRIKESGGSYRSVKNVDFTVAGSPLYNVIYEYDPSINDFIISRQPNWDNFVLDPWKGYYIYVQQGANTPISLDFGEAEGPPFPPTPNTSSKGSRLGTFTEENLFTPPSPPRREANLSLFEVAVSSFSKGNGSQVTFELIEKKNISVQNFKIKVKDLTGRTVFSSESDGAPLTWYAEDIANGVYLYNASLKLNNKIIQTKLEKLLIIK